MFRRKRAYYIDYQIASFKLQARWHHHNDITNITLRIFNVCIGKFKFERNILQ